MTVPTPEAQPVQGPSPPTRSDLIWATARSQAALDDPSLSVRDRLSYLEAEAATYTAAAHLREPTLADWVLSAPEPEVDADGYPGAEASPGDSRPAATASDPPGGREAWLKSYQAAVADLQQRNRDYLAARVPDLARELQAEVAEPEAGA